MGVLVKAGMALSVYRFRRPRMAATENRIGDEAWGLTYPELNRPVNQKAWEQVGRQVLVQAWSGAGRRR